MRNTAFILGLALGCAVAAHAADRHDSGTSRHEDASSQHVTVDLNHVKADMHSVLHRLGSATRHAWHRLDASLHRVGHHEHSTSS